MGRRYSAASSEWRENLSVHGLLDDIALHRTERTEQLAFLALRDLEFVERGDQIADQRVKVSAADAHITVLVSGASSSSSASSN